MTKAQRPVVEKDDYKITVTLNGRAATYTNDDFASVGYKCDWWEEYKTVKEQREGYIYSVDEQLRDEGFPAADARAVAKVVVQWVLSKVAKRGRA